MNQGPLLFVGVFFSLTISWLGLIVAPQIQIGRQQPIQADAPGGYYPAPRPGSAQKGLQVYRANGCYECHTLQAQRKGSGSDYERGWGKRLTVNRDFLHDSPAMLGSLRLGPDLANIGLRNTNATWHLLHLYNPKLTSPGSTMPQYPFLFEKRAIRGTPSPDALTLAGEHAPETGFEVVPKMEAHALVSYLLSLQAEVPLPEAPLPPELTRKAEDTNAPPDTAAATNAPTNNSPATQ